SAPEFMTGTLDTAEPLVTLSPVATGAGTSRSQMLVHSSVLSVLDQNHFTWVALDRGWRAVFTRQQYALVDTEGRARHGTSLKRSVLVDRKRWIVGPALI